MLHQVAGRYRHRFQSNQKQRFGTVFEKTAFPTFTPSGKDEKVFQVSHPYVLALLFPIK